jgi:hypothetical protein
LHASHNCYLEPIELDVWQNLPFTFGEVSSVFGARSSQEWEIFLPNLCMAKPLRGPIEVTRGALPVGEPDPTTHIGNGKTCNGPTKRGSTKNSGNILNRKKRGKNISWLVNVSM